MNIENYKTTKIVSSVFLIDTKGSGPLFLEEKNAHRKQFGHYF